MHLLILVDFYKFLTHFYVLRTAIQIIQRIQISHIIMSEIHDTVKYLIMSKSHPGTVQDSSKLRLTDV
jgi:hypothetical protein